MYLRRIELWLDGWRDSIDCFWNDVISGVEIEMMVNILNKFIIPLFIAWSDDSPAGFTLMMYYTLCVSQPGALMIYIHM